MLNELAWPDHIALLLAVVAFVLGGLVKGTLGVGLPLVEVPLLSQRFPPMQAIGMVAVPVLVSNVWQAWDSGVSAQGVRRFLPLIGMLMLFSVLTVPLTLNLPETALRRVLAAVVLLAVVLNAVPLQLQVPPRQERWWSALVGALSGVMGGVSALTGPIIISYLMNLRLSRETFVGTISIIYLAGALPLYGSMAALGRFTLVDLLLSALGLLPLGAGMLAGKHLRGKLSEAVFRRVLLAFLVLLALLLLLKN
jgi:uncharacterized membrane protein YfcA